MRAMSDTALTAEQRERIRALADVMFPRTAEMPSASDVDVSGRLVDQVLRAVPALADGLREALAAADGPASSAFVELRDRHPREARSLFLVLASAYYLAPEVQDRVGYHGQEARKLDFFELPEYLEDGTLDRVIARGPRWVDAAEGAAT